MGEGLKLLIVMKKLHIQVKVFPIFLQKYAYVQSHVLTKYMPY